MGALSAHEPWLMARLDHAPQTNEVARAAVLIAAARWLTARHGLPLVLSELGASAGLNLMFDRFALVAGGQHLGPEDPILTLTPDWDGPPPANATPRITDRAGVDLNPLDPVQDRNRLLSYIWPEQPDRLARTRAALNAGPPRVAKSDAIDWLATRLAPRPGHLHLIYHTVAWQYFPAHTQARGEALLAEAGARASPQAPLARFGMEADGTPDPTPDGTPDGAALTLHLWPDDVTLNLGRADFHGRWVRWTPPKEDQGMTIRMDQSVNVLGDTLALCSNDPVTGFFRDGHCNTCAADQGSHTVCAIMTAEFLALSKYLGNDLSTPRPEFGFTGLKPGDHWCLCAARFLQAHDEGAAPKINLAATHLRATDIVPLDLLRAYAADEA